MVVVKKDQGQASLPPTFRSSDPAKRRRGCRVCPSPLTLTPDGGGPPAGETQQSALMHSVALGSSDSLFGEGAAQSMGPPPVGWVGLGCAAPPPCRGDVVPAIVPRSLPIESVRFAPPAFFPGFPPNLALMLFFYFVLAFPQHPLGTKSFVT